MSDPEPRDPAAAPDGVIASLALMYHRHDDPARALALALAAMQLGPVTPRVVLLVAASFLRTGEAEQAAAALSRFDAEPPRLEGSPSATERAAAELLRAKALFRTGETDAARAALHRARAIREAEEAVA